MNPYPQTYTEYDIERSPCAQNVVITKHCAPQPKPADACMSKGLKVFLGILIAIALILFQALIVMILWNWVIPRIFIGAVTIDYFTAIGLVLLIDVLGSIWAAVPVFMHKW